MSDAIPVSARVRAIVAMDSAAAQREVERALRTLNLPGGHLEIVARACTWSAGDVSRLTEGQIDYLLVVSGSGERFNPGLVGEALRVIREDLTTAVVGPSVTGAVSGSLELAVSGHLLLLRADAIRAVGVFDPALHDTFDDLGLCWRLWAAGHRVRSIQAPGEDLRGADRGAVERHRALLHCCASALEPDDLLDATWSEGIPAEVVREAASVRKGLSALRRRGGAELIPMAHRWFEAWAGASSAGSDARPVVAELAAPHRAGVRRRILVVTTDVLAPAMAGPAIRAVAVARALAAEHDVRLATTTTCTLAIPGLDIKATSEAALEALVGWADIVVFQGWVMAGRAWLRDSWKVVIADVYDPMQLEQLEQGREATGERGRLEAVRGAAATLNEQLRRADFVLCASRKQRDLWMGSLAALGRVNPVTYDDDPSLGSLIDIAPFGVSDEPFPNLPGAIKGRIDGIGENDRVVLWGGGVYNWFDPLTLVRAIDRVRADVPDVRLFFLGLAHPNPDVPSMRMAQELRDLAASLGIVGTHVFFNEGWVDFESRASFLRDADVGVSTHLDHVETEFSFRTRILDYLWAGLPIVATGGDAFAELIEARGAGRTVPPQDVEALAAALTSVLSDADVAASYRRGSASLAAELTWSKNLEPLLSFCRAPRRAPDVACPTLTTSPDGAELRRGLRRDVGVAFHYLRAGGPRALGVRILGRLRRRWRSGADRTGR